MSDAPVVKMTALDREVDGRRVCDKDQAGAQANGIWPDRRATAQGYPEARHESLSGSCRWHGWNGTARDRGRSRCVRVGCGPGADGESVTASPSSRSEKSERPIVAMKRLETVATRHQVGSRWRGETRSSGSEGVVAQQQRGGSHGQAAGSGSRSVGVGD